MSNRGSRLTIGATLALLVLAISALLATTFEQHRRASSEIANAQSYGDYLLSNLHWLIWPPLLFALFTYVVAQWLVRRSLQPIETMRRELASVTSSNLGRRITVAGGGDEVAHLALSLNETLDRLQSAVLANERLVADAAHELRTPLTAVRAALEVENTRAPRELLADSVTEIDRAGKLIDDLLLLARSPSTDARLELVDLDDVLMQEIRRTERQYPGASVVQDIQPVQQRLAREDIASVARNLLENAAKYGGGQVKVTLSEQNGNSHLSVEDDGPGIAGEKREEVLRRFSRLEHSRVRSAGGSGLGLAIVNETVRAHRGTIEISDSTLGGCRVEILLPITESADAAGLSTLHQPSTPIDRPMDRDRSRFILAAAVLLMLGAGSTYVLQRTVADETVEEAVEAAEGAVSQTEGPTPLDRSAWSVDASTFFPESEPENAIDGDSQSRWSTGVFQTDELMFFEIDLGSPQTISRIDLELNSFTAQDYPRGYRVEVAPDSGDFGPAVAVNPAVEPTFPSTIIEFKSQMVQRIRISQTGSSETQWWSIAEVNVFE